MGTRFELLGRRAKKLAGNDGSERDEVGMTIRNWFSLPTG